jgi:hypothetical protein
MIPTFQAVIADDPQRGQKRRHDRGSCHYKKEWSIEHSLGN